MGKSLIQTTNQNPTAIAENGILSLGSVLRRYGCNCRLSGNAIEVAGEGYYKVDATVSVEPTAEGNVTVALYNNGVQVQGAIAYGTASAASDPVTLPIVTTIRQGCCCDSADSLTLVLLEGAGTVTNVSLRVERS